MQNFVFHNPTKVLFGKNTIPAIGSETCAFGKKILLVYGCGSIKRNGIYQQAVTSLEEAGAKIYEHSGVQSNPILSHVQTGIELAKDKQVEVICAIGGGSVIDTAKAISAGALVDHNVWKFFTGKKSVRTILPLTCIVTLAAAGSEMNSGMVVTNDTTNQKFGFANRLLYPKTSILDPETTYTVPANYTAYGAIDALAHLLEFYCTTMEHATSVQDRFIEGLAVNICESCDSALNAPHDYSARATLMWSAALALNGLTAAGLGKVGFPMHLIEHSLSALYNVPHGAGLSVVIPGWLRYQADKIPDRLHQFFHRVFGIGHENGVDISEGIAHLTRWFAETGSPTRLEDLQIPVEDIGRIAENTLPLAKIWRMREYSQDVVEQILHLCTESGQR